MQGAPCSYQSHETLKKGKANVTLQTNMHDEVLQDFIVQHSKPLINLIDGFRTDRNCGSVDRASMTFPLEATTNNVLQVKS